VATILDKISRIEGVSVFVVAPPKYKIVVSAKTKEEADQLLEIAKNCY
jgi:hypothetical protein